MKLRYVTAIAALVALAAGCERHSAKRFYWVQPLKGNPTHQLTQIGFAEGCRKVGYECKIVGSDEDDTGATIALAEQALATGDVAGMCVWAGSPAYRSLVAKAAKAGVPVVVPHFPWEKADLPGAAGIVGGDPAECGATAAEVMGRAIGGKGTVAITEGSFNPTENPVAESFTKTMAAKFPGVTVLKPQLEGFDAAAAIALETQIILNHSDLAGAISSTGSGAQNWAKAQEKSHRKLTIIGMNATRINLDLVKKGDVYALMAQPMWEESYKAAELLEQLTRKQEIPWWTKLPIPVVTRENVDKFYDIPDKVDAALHH